MSSIPELGRTTRNLNKRLNEPWRYRCPECESTTIEVRGSAQSTSPLMFKEGRETTSYVARQQKDIHVHHFRCRGCNSVFDDPIDAKTGEPVDGDKLRGEL